MNVCALIAAFNEEPTIAAVVAGVRRHTPDVVVVDDGSSDRTGERAAAAGATVVRHAQNRGKGAAIRTGLAHVLAGPHTHVLFIDADRSSIAGGAVIFCCTNIDAPTITARPKLGCPRFSPRNLSLSGTDSLMKDHG